MVAAAVVVGVGVATAQTVVAATAEQQDQDDDPPAAVTTETIVTHKDTSKFYWAVMPLIPWYSAAEKRCGGTS